MRSKLVSRVPLLSAVLVFALSTACGSNNASGNGGYATASDASSGADGTAGTGGQTGDDSTNKVSVAAKDDSGKSTDVSSSKPAAKGDADKKILGASSAAEMLNLFITDDKGTVLTVYIDTKAHPLPKKGIPVGEPNGKAWVTLATGGGVFNSKSTGTIDIDTCPEKQGVAIVGKFNGVVVHNEAPVGAKTQTLDGTFNLVYYGGAGALTCKPKETGGGGEKVDMGAFGKPKSATCDANPCDGGANSTRNCCPYVPCLSSCWQKCVGAVQACVMGCGVDFSCPQKCTMEVFACQAKCPVTCEVSGTCSAAIEKLNKCEQNNAPACGNEDQEKADACTFDKCCAEAKAAF
ncbi:MAG: hypothetical protein KC502_04215 [Myxococcales bacterium]|nr:hypothetical protein [Myxococcales bacterium]